MWTRGRILLVLPCAFLLYMLVSMLNTEPPNTTARRINRAIQLLEFTQQRNEKLRAMVMNFSRQQVDNSFAQKLIERLEYSSQNPRDAQSNDTADGSRPLEPSFEYEFLRRRIRNNIAEIWNYFGNELGKLRIRVAPTQPALAQRIDKVLQLGAEHKRSLLSDMERLQQVDGYETWRQQEARHMTDLVQRRLQYLQNPKDCKNALKLVCEFDKDCGFGCQLHHVVNCFIAAYATGRTMILKSAGWRYHKSGWEQVFLPVSETCFEAMSTNDWPDTKDGRLIKLPDVDLSWQSPVYMPPAVPEDLATRLQRLHGDPAVWWVGQFLKYLLRPQKDTADFLESSKLKLGWQKPIVGVFVERRGKVYSDAGYHSIEEYMSHVEDYFLTLEINGSTPVSRRIFLVTDEADVIKKTRRKYPQYKVSRIVEVEYKATESMRYSRTALNGIIRDIHFLAHCDYIVCTFSSQDCRVAFEIMQTLQPDAAHHLKSLDDIYYFEVQNTRLWQMIIGHEARNHDEIDVRPGDLVGVSGNNWGGFSGGENLRTYQRGLFPSFKGVDRMKTVKMPLYEQVSLQV